MREGWQSALPAPRSACCDQPPLHVRPTPATLPPCSFFTPLILRDLLGASKTSDTQVPPLALWGGGGTFAARQGRQQPLPAQRASTPSAPTHRPPTPYLARQVVLLSAVPFACSACVHLCNALHSQVWRCGLCATACMLRAFEAFIKPARLPPCPQRVMERRFHIAIPWALGSICLYCMSTAASAGEVRRRTPAHRLRAAGGVQRAPLQGPTVPART